MENFDDDSISCGGFFWPNPFDYDSDSCCSSPKQKEESEYDNHIFEVFVGKKSNIHEPHLTWSKTGRFKYRNLLEWIDKNFENEPFVFLDDYRAVALLYEDEYDLDQSDLEQIIEYENSYGFDIYDPKFSVVKSLNTHQRKYLKKGKNGVKGRRTRKYSEKKISKEHRSRNKVSHVPSVRSKYYKT